MGNKTKKNNIETYIEMLKKNEQLNKLRPSKKKRKKIFLIVCSIICIFGIVDTFLPDLTPLMFYLFIIGLIILWNAYDRSKYKNIFKEQIISTIMKKDYSNLKYLPKSGIDEKIYRSGKFEKYDTYFTEDLIEFDINGIQLQLADVHTVTKSKDEDIIEFSGPVAVLEYGKFNNLMLDISVDFGNRFLNDEYIEIENSEFENIFDVFTNNEILAMRILTPRISEKITELYNNSGVSFEIKLINGLLFFRFHSRSLFKTDSFDIESEASNIVFSYNLIDKTKKIVIEILEILNEVEE